jgi:hypothetical protein
MQSFAYIAYPSGYFDIYLLGYYTGTSKQLQKRAFEVLRHNFEAHIFEGIIF